MFFTGTWSFTAVQSVLSFMATAITLAVALTRSQNLLHKSSIDEGYKQ
ncbi:hypothetical protein [Allocoleopsis franciscana]|uniref:Uncharacterized protein n=1 Tax=Allocoleopsis franciscana PCC 7113 TaxID=1173027 RepID=K9WMA4_9CYAN|nr:hypothetical protein [Allocoleopsis franciscana]AFZ20936.1 hypothetical protein Mic7113_5287 [Allocoleopsis franciscana PCC 7113]